MKKALLVLENGYYDFAESFASDGTVYGEIVFNTSMTGYEEILTDPSYKGQIVNFTYPLIGNYGITKENPQSDSIMAEAIIIRELSNITSNFDSKIDLANYLKESGKIGIHKLDTRALTKQIRFSGAIKGAISTEILDPKVLLDKVKNSPSISDEQIYERVVNKDIEIIKGNPDSKYTIAVVNFGIKDNMIKELAKLFKNLIIVPFSKNILDDLLKLRFDGIFLSNGPGDPRIINNIEFIQYYASKYVPITGICFGHQLIGKAFNLDIIKLPYGHHGGNHPIKNIENGNVFISSQNHNYAISLDSINKDEDWELTWLHLNDNTVSGFKHKRLPIISVQFHPEASPGPNDANTIIFNDFYNLIEKNATKN